MKKLSLLYEGKAKKVFLTEDDNIYLIEYKDDATAFNGEKRGTITGKGELNNRISGLFFQLLSTNGVNNHYLKQISKTEQLVKKVSIIPIEAVVRNIVAGSLAKRLGLEEGIFLKQPIVEFYYKDDQLGDPLINTDHITVLNIATLDQLTIIRETSLRINEILTGFLESKDILLVDFKLEFGTTQEGDLILADEISPDTCRFWDRETKEKLDKDRFRRNLGSVEDAYKEILRRLGEESNV